MVTAAEATQTALQMPFALEMVGVVVGSMCGALTACERKLDIIGCVALGMVCALGGGLLRDMIMQVGSVYIIDSDVAIHVSVVVALVVFFFHGLLERFPNAIEWLDILAVALFAASGADKAMTYNMNIAIVLLMGVLTGNGGGLIRDIVLGDVPKLFQRGNWYAICSLGGTLAYWLLVEFCSLDKGIAGTISVLLTILLRRLSLRYNLLSPADVDLSPNVEQGLKHLKRPSPTSKHCSHEETNK